MTCDSDSPTVTVHARRGPAVPDAVRTQRGPASLRNGRRPIRSHRPAISALAIQLALTVPLKAPAMQAQLAANPVEPVAEAGHVAPTWPQAHVQTLACCQGLGNLRTRTPPTMAETAPTTSVQIPAPTEAAISSDSLCSRPAPWPPDPPAGSRPPALAASHQWPPTRRPVPIAARIAAGTPDAAILRVFTDAITKLPAS